MICITNAQITSHNDTFELKNKRQKFLEQLRKLITIQT